MLAWECLMHISRRGKGQKKDWKSLRKRHRILEFFLRGNQSIAHKFRENCRIFMQALALALTWTKARLPTSLPPCGNDGSFIEKETIFYSSYNRRFCGQRLDPGIACLCVQNKQREVFAFIANTGSTRKVSLALDTERLGMTGGYKATIMRVSSKGTIQKSPLKDLIYDGKVEINTLQKNEYCGLFFERKKALPPCIVD